MTLDLYEWSIRGHYSTLFPTALHYGGSIPTAYKWFHFNPLTIEDKEFLNQPHTVEEIKSAVWQLGPWKAPGSDGIPIGFYKEHWDLVGQDITQMVLSFLTRHSTLHHINSTDIVLIPKFQSQQTPIDFTPIGL